MLDHSASRVMSTSVLEALAGKIDIKRHSPSILSVPDVLLTGFGKTYRINISIHYQLLLFDSWNLILTPTLLAAYMCPGYVSDWICTNIQNRYQYSLSTITF